MDIQPLIKQDFVVVDEDATIAEMIGKLKHYEKHVALVFRKNKYLGLVEKKPLLRARLDPSETKIRNYVQKTPLLNEAADLIESAYLMFQSNLDVLPVERNKQIIGVVDGLDLARQALLSAELKRLVAGDVRLVKPTKLGKDEPVAAALDVLYKERIDHLPIYDQGALFGILSYKDILRKYLSWTPKRDFSVKFNKAVRSKGAEAEISSIAQLPVSSFSTNENLLTSREGALLRDAIELMSRNKVHDLVVMKGDEVVGLLTVKNILRRIGSLQIPANFNIKFVGLNDLDLDPAQKAHLQKITSNEALKLQHKIKNEFTLVVHLKEYARAGEKGRKKGKEEKRIEKRSGKGEGKSGQQEGAKQHKFSVHLRLEYPGKALTVAQDDWDIETALHKTFDNAQNALEKRFKTYDKAYETRAVRKKGL